MDDKYVFIFQDWNMMQDIHSKEKDESRKELRISSSSSLQGMEEKRIASDLQRMRIQRRMSVSAMSDLLGVSPSDLSDMEEGKRSISDSIRKRIDSFLSSSC